MKFVVLVAAAVCLVSLPACAGIERLRFVAQIVTSGSDSASVSMPTSVQAGEEFEVAVLSYRATCEEVGPVEVEVSGFRAMVTPYDFRRLDNPNCPGGEHESLRTAILVFASPGTATVVVEGRDLDGEPIFVTRLLTVR